MLFPEITSRVTKALSGTRALFGSAPIELGLKGLSGFSGAGEWYARNGFRTLAEAYGGSGPTWSGESVSLDRALNHSVVFTCKRVLAESTGFLPLTMMQRKGGEKNEAIDHPMYTVLHDGTYDISAQRLRETMTGHCVLGGNAYAQIFRRTNTGVANDLNLLLPSEVNTDREKYGRKNRVYLVKEGNAAERTYTVEEDKPQDILHIPGIGWDGVKGYSILTLGRQSFGTAIAAERNVGKFYANGGRLPYVLSLAQKMNDEDFDKFRADWEKIYAEPHRAPILEPFIKEYKQIGLSAVDSQLLETRQFSVSEICRWFRISPHLAGDLSRATFSNIEQLALEFVNFTLHVWLKRWEQELWRCVLTPTEKSQGYFWRHNVNALLRGDFAARMAGYATALQNGFMSQNEVRDLEDWNGFKGGDDYHIQLNMQQLPTAAGQPQQQTSLVNLGTRGSAQRAD